VVPLEVGPWADELNRTPSLVVVLNHREIVW
jgi:hypothetical protein